MTDRQKANEPNKSEIAKSEAQSKNTPENFTAQYDYPQMNDFSENSRILVWIKIETDYRSCSISKSLSFSFVMGLLSFSSKDCFSTKKAFSL